MSRKELRELILSYCMLTKQQKKQKTQTKMLFVLSLQKHNYAILLQMICLLLMQSHFFVLYNYGMIISIVHYWKL